MWFHVHYQSLQPASPPHPCPNSPKHRCKLQEPARLIYPRSHNMWGFAGGSVVKNLHANAGYAGWSPGSGRSPGERNHRYSLQYSCLENLVFPGSACRVTVRGVARVGYHPATKLQTLPAQSMWATAVRLKTKFSNPNTHVLSLKAPWCGGKMGSWPRQM